MNGVTAHIRQGRIEESSHEHISGFTFTESTGLEVEHLVIINWTIGCTVSTSDHIVLADLKFRDAICFGMFAQQQIVEQLTRISPFGPSFDSKHSGSNRPRLS